MYPSSPPSGSEPVSPMNTCAGWQLNQRKPTTAPIIPAARTANSPQPAMCGTFKIGGPLGVSGRIDHERHRRRGEQHAPARQAVQPVGQFTAFDDPTMTRMASGTNQSPSDTADTFHGGGRTRPSARAA